MVHGGKTIRSIPTKKILRHVLPSSKGSNRCQSSSQQRLNTKPRLQDNPTRKEEKTVKSFGDVHHTRILSQSNRHTCSDPVTFSEPPQNIKSKNGESNFSTMIPHILTLITVSETVLKSAMQWFESCISYHFSSKELRKFRNPISIAKDESNTMKRYASLCIVKERGAEDPKLEDVTQNGLPDAYLRFEMTEKNYKKRKKSEGFGDAPKIKTLSQAKKDLIANGPTIGDFIQNGLSEPVSISEPPQNIKRKKGERLPLPPWLRTKIPVGLNYHKVKTELKELKLNTVCAEAKCPHIGECWGGPQPTATIMLMGDQCTRGCRFCSVRTARNPPPLDKMEPQNTAEAIASWGLDYVVLTSVDRDDLLDGGSSHFAETVREIKRRKPSLNVECLTPDFQGNHDLVKIVAESGLDVYAHNIEAIRRMQMVRDPRAGYKQSLGVLEYVKKNFPYMITKTSIMVGWEETDDEIRQTMKDCRDVGIDCFTIGQYMQPTKRHIQIKEYVHPDKFKQWEEMGKEMGFLFVASGPLVRSSYKAGEYFLNDVLNKRQHRPNRHMATG